jgi:hypothetical protein
MPPPPFEIDNPHFYLMVWMAGADDDTSAGG